MRVTRTIGLICVLVPTIVAAAPVNLSDALTFSGSSATFRNFGSGTASTSLAGNPAAWTSAQSFTGNVSANARIDIDRFDSATARGFLDWEYDFLVNEPYLGHIRVNFAYGVSGSAYSNLSAGSYGQAGNEYLQATISHAGFSQSLVFADLFDSESCDSSWPGDCGTYSFSQTLNTTQDFVYDSGYPVGSLLRIRGSTWAFASADTYAGSAESSGSAWASFTVTAVPAPSTLGLAVLAVGLMTGARRRRLRERTTDVVAR